MSRSSTTILVFEKKKSIGQETKEDTSMKRIIGLAALAVVLACGSRQRAADNVKIGVLTDMSSLYADCPDRLRRCGQAGGRRFHERSPEREG